MTDAGPATGARVVEVTLHTTCSACAAEVWVRGAHLSVTCRCGQRIGVSTAVLAAPLQAFDDEGPEAGELERAGATWRWTAKAGSAPPEATATAAPVLLVTQIPSALRVIGGDDGGPSEPGPEPRWWVELDGPGRAALRRQKKEELRRRRDELDAQRLADYQRSVAEAARFETELATRREEERVQHDRVSRAALGLAWGFVAVAGVGVAATSFFLLMQEQPDLSPGLLAAVRILLTFCGGLMGLMALIVSSAAAAYRVHEPLMAYIGFAVAVAFGATLPLFGLFVSIWFSARLTLGRDPTLRGVRRTTPGGGKPMAVALTLYTLVAQIGAGSLFGPMVMELWRLM